jgi:hypothetical protein
VLDEAGASRLIKTMKELTAAVATGPEAQQKLVARMNLPLDDQIAETERDAATRRILKANGLSAKDYVVGLFAFRAARYAATGTELGKLANPKNVAFLEAHPKLIEQMTQAEMGK